MRKLLWLIPLFFFLPTVIGVLDFYTVFATGTGFMPRGDTEVFVLRMLTLLFSGFAGIISTAALADL